MNKAIEDIPRIFAVIQVAYAGNGVPEIKSVGTQAGSTPARHSRVQNKSLDGSGYGTLGRFDSCRRTQALVNLRGIANPYRGNKHEARQSRKRGIPAAVMVHWAGSIPAAAQITTKTQRI
ncbi:MAG: hypothetical protein IKO34_04385 [Bacteroidales bacterium]|nr:hypothetical protein [Bacteroidales bacterium]